MILRDEIINAERKEIERLRSDGLITGDMHRVLQYNKEYFDDYRSNLIISMAVEHQKQYGVGSGGETEEHIDKLGRLRPAKMASIRSSSAMTFNLLGNHQIVMKDNDKKFAPGNYKIEYEKQLYTLRGAKNMPANLDAYLCREKTT